MNNATKYACDALPKSAETSLHMPIHRNACTYCTMRQEVNIIHLPIYTNFKNMNKNA